MITKGVLVAGLPASCKTTFLAALWHLIVSDEIETSLTLRELGGAEYSHLNRLTSSWQRAVAQERTTLMSGLHRVSMLLVDKDERALQMHFPDISGEHFENAWIQRVVPSELAEYVRDTDATLLFINHEHVKSPVTVEQMRKQLDALGEAPEPESAERDWDPKQSPTQVMLIDIMQIIDDLRRSTQGDVSLIVSAWDTTASQWKDAYEYVERELPMLHQYLVSRRQNESPAYRAYGVSAQGGTLPDDREEILSQAVAANRIRVVQPSGSHHDLTTILRDLLN